MMKGGGNGMTTNNIDGSGFARHDDMIKESVKETGSSRQVGGNHYKDCVIQPTEYIVKNKLDFLEGNVVKYITRHRKKGGGKKDIEKAIHYAQLILELHYSE